MKELRSIIERHHEWAKAHHFDADDHPTAKAFLDQMNAMLHEFEAAMPSNAPRVFACPVPVVAPLGYEVDDPALVQGLWDTFIKPGQERGDLQSVEDRGLMAVLRAVYHGLETS